MQIIMNGNPVPLGGDIPDKVEYLQIYTSPIMFQPLHPSQIVQVKAWLNDLVDTLDLVGGYFIYDGIICEGSIIKKF